MVDSQVAALMAMLCFPLLAACAETPTGETKMPELADLPIIKELPDPFLFRDGSRVKTKEDWARRREELRALILQYEYGHLPPPPGNVAGKELSSKKDEATGATVKEILLTMGPENRVQAHLDLYVPDGKGPFPAVIRGDLSWGKLDPKIVAAAVKRGYVIADFNRTEIVPDSKERTGAYPVYPDCDWGALAAWAWGFHRVVDYLVTLDSVDRAKIAATGHSRGGKAVLLAGALDERIAVTVPNNSGCGGAGCYRFLHGKCEDIAAILRNFPFWFQPRFGQFVGHVEQLPFDQHSLKALVAPRALLSTEALGDLWANPKGTQQTYLAAREVYEFLGVPGKIGICYREGKHEQNLDDWTVLLDFCDQQLLGKQVERKFGQLAFPDLPKAHSWAAPGR